ncbi:MAG: hypothetical protein E7231_13860 [Cellulosilyticum sp.]|nr:hypothetical protein [Cellulosilyticum sp.]
MKTIFKSLLIGFILCLGVGNLFAAEGTYITEEAFATLLNDIHKVEANAQVGSQNILTREKAACMIVDFLGYTALAKERSQRTSFSDVINAKGEIEVISQLGIMNGIGNGQFQPNLSVTVETATAIIEKLKQPLQKPTTWKHACYAISSSSQMEEIKNYQAVSFGWAEVLKGQEGFKVSTTEGSLKVPSGFEMPIDLAKANGVETYIMVYFEGKNGQAESLLKDATAYSKIIAQIVEMTKGISKDGVTRGFDGVTIDFESLTSASIKANYVGFLKTLQTALKAEGKKLNVAVQPTLYYKGYDYKGIGEIADHVILMAHDYGAKKLTLSEQQLGMTTTPLTPIDEVYLALLEAKKAIADRSKIALQFSFASLQWQEQNGTVLNATAYTPSYDKIQTRLKMPGTVAQFDGYNQSSYATYEENGVTNIIWYEDAKSIQAKMDLAKLLGITNFSYWRLGMIPNEISRL